MATQKNNTDVAASRNAVSNSIPTKNVEFPKILLVSILVGAAVFAVQEVRIRNLELNNSIQVGRSEQDRARMDVVEKTEIDSTNKLVSSIDAVAASTESQAIEWSTEGNRFRLQEVAIGTFSAPPNLVNLDGGYYKGGEEVYAVALKLKIDVGAEASSCVAMTLRRYVPEADDYFHPNTRQFYFPSGGCSVQGRATYPGQQVLFVVPREETEFYFTTAGNPPALKVILTKDTIQTSVLTKAEFANIERTSSLAGRDRARVSDINLLASALNSYFAQNKFYPERLENLTPYYLQELPKAPTPPDGECTSAQNTYKYTAPGLAVYGITFCLGSHSGTLEPGAHTATPQGIR